VWLYVRGLWPATPTLWHGEKLSGCRNVQQDPFGILFAPPTLLNILFSHVRLTMFQDGGIRGFRVVKQRNWNDFVDGINPLASIKCAKLC